MNRRRLLAGGMAACMALGMVPPKPLAQTPAKIRRMGLLSPFSVSSTAQWHDALRRGLRELGWVEGRNISIETRYADGKSDRLAGLAADLVRLGVDIIV